LLNILLLKIKMTAKYINTKNIVANNVIFKLINAKTPNIKINTTILKIINNVLKKLLLTIGIFWKILKVSFAL
mgnify:CR=1